MRVGLAATAVCAMLVGCATGPEMRSTWVRIDGQPASQPDVEQSILQCRGQAAASAANTPQAAYPNIYMMAAAQNQRNETLAMVMQGCMSQRGYVLVQMPVEPTSGHSP